MSEDVSFSPQPPVPPEAREAANKEITEYVGRLLPSKQGRALVGQHVQDAITRALAAQTKELAQHKAIANESARLATDLGWRTDQLESPVDVISKELARLREENERLTRERDAYRADGLIGAKAWAYDGVCRELGVERDCIGVIHAFRSRIATLEQQARDKDTALQELISAMHRYEGDVDCSPTIEHREMMRRAYVAIYPATAATNEGGSEG